MSAIAAATVLSLTQGDRLKAQDLSRYPDWSGQWKMTVSPTSQVAFGFNWDPDKGSGLAQQAPLTPEYQAIYDASLAAQGAGGHGSDLRWTCRTSGMPRIMTAVYPIEIIIQPTTTFILSEYVMPRRIYTDGRTRPEIVEPAFAGYSVGKWIDENGDGRYDVLEVETTHMKGPRDFDVGSRKCRCVSFVPGQRIVDVISPDDGCLRYHSIQPPSETISLRFGLMGRMVERRCYLPEQPLNVLIVPL